MGWITARHPAYLVATQVKISRIFTAAILSVLLVFFVISPVHAETKAADAQILQKVSNSPYSNGIASNYSTPQLACSGWTSNPVLAVQSSVNYWNCVIQVPGWDGYGINKVSGTLSCPSGSSDTANGCVVLSCPTGQNWTLSGTTCTRPDCPSGQHRLPSGVCTPDCPSGYHPFIPEDGRCEKDCIGKQHQDSTGLCVCDKTSGKLFKYTAGTGVGGASCDDGCSITSLLSTSYCPSINQPLVSSGAVSAGTSCFAYGGQTGQLCTPTAGVPVNITLAPAPPPPDTSGTGPDNQTPDPKNTPENNKGPVECGAAGGVYGTYNGAGKCLTPSAENIVQKQSEGSKKITNPDGSTTEVKTETTETQSGPDAPHQTTTKETTTNCTAAGVCNSSSKTTETKSPSTTGAGTGGTPGTGGGTGTGWTGTGTGGGGTDDGTSDLCAKHPDIPACKSICVEKPDLPQCKDLGDPPEEGALATIQRGVQSITPTSFATAATCPPPIEIGKFGRMTMQPVCDLATGVRPLLIALAWLSAGLIVLGAFRNG